MRYEMRLLENGWLVWDTETNPPAAIGGRWRSTLYMEVADDLVLALWP